MRVNESELKAMVVLLDDEDAEVVNHIEDKIMSIGTDVIPLLEQEWESSFNPTVQKRIEELVHDLQFELLKERLVEWKENPEKQLLEGLWLVATYQYPDLDFSEIYQEVEQLYQELWRNMKEDLNPYETVKLINDVFFNQFRFRSNTKNFHSPANSMINAVLESKKGNPILLCATYLCLIEKLELPIYGVNLPNLFILTYKTEKINFYINVFNRGLIFTREDIDNYLNNLQIPQQDIFYEPCSNLDIILRCFRNLVVAFDELGDYHKSDEIKAILQLIDDNYFSI